jgi:hypothetical protein
MCSSTVRLNQTTWLSRAMHEPKRAGWKMWNINIAACTFRSSGRKQNRTISDRSVLNFRSVAVVHVCCSQWSSKQLRIVKRRDSAALQFNLNSATLITLQGLTRNAPFPFPARALTLGVARFPRAAAGVGDPSLDGSASRSWWLGGQHSETQGLQGETHPKQLQPHHRCELDLSPGLDPPNRTHGTFGA